MNIRKPDEAEINRVLALSQQAMFEGTLGEVKLTNEEAKQMIDPLLRKGSNYLIAEEDNELMGWILFGGTKDQFSNKEIGFIYELFVLEEYRGRKLSTQLVEAGIVQLKKEKYSEVRLSVFAGNYAVKIYEKLGFENKKITMSRPL